MQMSRAFRKTKYLRFVRLIFIGFSVRNLVCLFVFMKNDRIMARHRWFIKKNRLIHPSSVDMSHIQMNRQQLSMRIVYAPSVGSETIHQICMNSTSNMPSQANANHISEKIAALLNRLLHLLQRIEWINEISLVSFMTALLDFVFIRPTRHFVLWFN